jgi:hypothetical protein
MTTKRAGPEPAPASADPERAQKIAARLAGVTPARARQMLADQKARLSQGARKAAFLGLVGAPSTIVVMLTNGGDTDRMAINASIQEIVTGRSALAW